MARKFSTFLLAALVVGLASPLVALEKIKYASPVRTDAVFYLTALAGEEKGFWKENGLDVEWVPFAGATPLGRAIAAGEINLGAHVSSGPPVLADRGLPVVMVAGLVAKPAFAIWVRGDSPYRHPRDMKGTKIGVTGLGAPTHLIGLLIMKANGMEKDVRFVGAGGVPEYMAALRTDSVQAIVSSHLTQIRFMLEGVTRLLAHSADYLPKPWLEHVIFARKDFARSKPDVVRKAVKAIAQITDFIRKNPRWTMDRMKSFQGLSEEAAKATYDNLEFATTVRIERPAVENLRRIFMEYGVISEKAPPVDELFTNEYVS